MIQLQPFNEADFSRLISWIDHPRLLVQWAGPFFTYPLTKAELIQHLKETEGQDPKTLIFKAIDADTKEVVGHIELLNIDRQNCRATIGRVLVGPNRLRNQGIGANIVRAVMQIGFEELGLHRLELRAFDFNQRAIACYEKVGFKREGIIRESCKFEAEYWTAIQLSMLEDEWRGLK